VSTLHSEQKICIIGGFTEGNHHATKFVRLLREAGFGITKRAEVADIIVTHSGGYLFLPDDLSTKTVVMVAPPCGYQSSKFNLFWRNWRIDFRAHYTTGALGVFWRKDLYNFWYFITKPGYNYRIVRGVARFRFKLLRTHAKKTIVITNRDDLWTRHIPERALQEEPAYTFIGLVGAHDDLWLNPERYVAILKACL